MDEVDVVSLGSASEPEREQAAAFRLPRVSRVHRSTIYTAKAVTNVSSGLQPQGRIASTKAEAGVAMQGQAFDDEPLNAVAKTSTGLTRSQQGIVDHEPPSLSSATVLGKELSSYRPGFLALCMRSYVRRFHPIFPCFIWKQLIQARAPCCTLQ